MRWSQLCPTPWQPCVCEANAGFLLNPSISKPLISTTPASNEQRPDQVCRAQGSGLDTGQGEEGSLHLIVGQLQKPDASHFTP